MKKTLITLFATLLATLMMIGNADARHIKTLTAYHYFSLSPAGQIGRCLPVIQHANSHHGGLAGKSKHHWDIQAGCTSPNTGAYGNAHLTYVDVPDLCWLVVSDSGTLKRGPHGPVCGAPIAIPGVDVDSN